MEEWQVNRKAMLEKFPGKGGWIYISVPEISPAKNSPFGWVHVNGWIDDFELKTVKLMPKGDGSLFLAVGARIRKKIGKVHGDTVDLKLTTGPDKIVIPEEITECFQSEPPGVLEFFNSLDHKGKKDYLDWIYSARDLDSRAERIIKMMEKLSRRERLYW